MPKSDGWKTEMATVADQSITFRMEDWTTPIRFAKLLHASNARRAREVASGMPEGLEHGKVSLAGYTVVNVGKFIEAIDQFNKANGKAV